MNIQRKVRVLLTKERQRQRSYPRQLSSLNRFSNEGNFSDNPNSFRENLDS